MIISGNVYGVDLGTCNFKVFCKDSGKIYNEKNTIAIINKDEIYAYGDAAYAMYEKAPESLQITFPVTSGVIADFNNLQNMIFDFLEHKAKGKLKGSEFVVAVPTDITNVEKRAFYEIFSRGKFKAKSIFLCEKPIADAVGLGLDVNEPTGSMIVNLGADTTEISVISLGGLVQSELLHFGGNRLDESIITYMRREYNLVIGQKTAKSLKETIGSGLPGREESMVIVGRDVISGLPIEMEVKAEDVYKAIQANLENICSSIKLTLEKTPPELAKDIIAAGIYITGGGAQIDRLAELFANITNIKVNVANEPEESAVRGLLKIVSEPKYKRLLFQIRNIDLK